MRDEKTKRTPWRRTPAPRMLLPLLLALLSGACGGGDDDAKSLDDLCRDSCVASMGAQCPVEVGMSSAQCEQDCLSVFASAPGCEFELRTWTACPGLLVASGWSCDTDGLSIPSTGVCTAEQQTATTCMQNNP